MFNSNLTQLSVYSSLLESTSIITINGITSSNGMSMINVNGISTLQIIATSQDRSSSFTYNFQLIQIGNLFIYHSFNHFYL